MIKKILAICGSTRQSSINLGLIHAIQAIAGEQVDIQLFSGLASLPHFNPDDDKPGDTAPATVAAFREQLAVSDGVIICTPEYAKGLPGSLKNALDWTVSSSSFSGKPVMVITASTMGDHAHASLLATLGMIEAVTDAQDALLIPHAGAKMSKEGEIKDEMTEAAVRNAITHFLGRLNQG